MNPRHIRFGGHTEERPLFDAELTEYRNVLQQQNKSVSFGILQRRNYAVVKRFVITMTLLALARVDFSACGEDIVRENWPVKPVGLEVGDPVLPKVRNLLGRSWGEGTVTILQCSPPQDFIIAWDENRSSISRYVDERGNNLAGEFRDGHLEGSSLNLFGYSQDNRHSFIQLWGKRIPDSSAASITASGNLLFIVAGHRRIHFRENVPLKAGQDIVCGGQTIVIEDIDERLHRLRFRPDYRAGEVRFFDALGKEIAVWKRVYDVLDSEGRVILDKHTRLESTFMKRRTDLEKVSVEIIEWKDIGAVVVPFDVSVSIGLKSAEEGKNVPGAGSSDGSQKGPLPAELPVDDRDSRTIDAEKMLPLARK